LQGAIEQKLNLEPARLAALARLQWDHGEKTDAHPRNRLTISLAVLCWAGCPPMFSSSDSFSRGAQALSLNEFTREKS
jgi:hypothetical protein